MLTKIKKYSPVMFGLFLGVIAMMAFVVTRPSTHETSFEVPSAYGVTFQDAGIIDGGAYLVNTVTLVQNGQSARIRAGEYVVNAATATALMSAGGVLAPASDPNVAAAAAIVQKIKARGGNEDECTHAMMAGYTYSAYQGLGIPVVDAGGTG